MRTTSKDLKKIYTELINSLDDGIIVINEKKEIIIINDSAVHLLTNKLFSLTDKTLKIKKKGENSKDTIFINNLRIISSYFELYPSSNNIIVSANAKDDTENTTILYRKVLKITEPNRTYYIIIIKI